MTLAILCSGQGRQHRGMFGLTGDAPEAAYLFEHAATLLGGTDPREFVRTAPEAALYGNRVAQILCTVQALAAAAALRDVFGGRRVVAGYSVGEVPAWGVAGFLRPPVAMDLAVHRAEAMDAVASPGEGMLFVRGLVRDAIEQLCAQHGAEIAIVNPDDAFVLGGTRIALGLLAEAAKGMKASRIVELRVGVASHTRRLAKATVAFREILTQAEVSAAPVAGTRLLSGVDGAAVLDVGTGFDKLAQQISRTVQWADCLRASVEAGATAFLELGPGRALSEMCAGAWPDIPSRSLDDFRTLQGVRAWLARHGLV